MRASVVSAEHVHACLQVEHAVCREALASTRKELGIAEEAAMRLSQGVPQEIYENMEVQKELLRDAQRSSHQDREDGPGSAPQARLLTARTGGCSVAAFAIGSLQITGAAQWPRQ